MPQTKEFPIYKTLIGSGLVLLAALCLWFGLHRESWTGIVYSDPTHIESLSHPKLTKYRSLESCQADLKNAVGSATCGRDCNADASSCSDLTTVK